MTPRHKNFQAIQGVSTTLEFETQTGSDLDLDLTGSTVRLDVFNIDGDLQYAAVTADSVMLGKVGFVIPGSTFMGFEGRNWPYRFTALPAGRSPLVTQGFITVLDLGLSQPLAIVP